MDVWSANRKTGLGEINGDLLEADFGPVVRLSPVCVN